MLRKLLLQALMPHARIVIIVLDTIVAVAVVTTLSLLAAFIVGFDWFHAQGYTEPLAWIILACSAPVFCCGDLSMYMKGRYRRVIHQRKLETGRQL